MSAVEIGEKLAKQAAGAREEPLGEALRYVTQIGLIPEYSRIHPSIHAVEEDRLCTWIDELYGQANNGSLYAKACLYFAADNAKNLADPIDIAAFGKDDLTASEELIAAYSWRSSHVPRDEKPTLTPSETLAVLDASLGAIELAIEDAKHQRAIE